jgi:osmotically-inducible protein OsmY
MTVINDTFSKKQDDRIREDVVRQIEWDPEIESTDISVKVDESNVFLSGFVHGYLEKMDAERAAKSVYGVSSVANDIEVKPKTERTDPEIARDVVQTLKLHSSVPEDRLNVTVRDGFVTLNGTVVWNFERLSAERAAHTISGVRGLINLIQIKPSNSIKQVTEKIEDAWKRTSDLDTRRMSVVADDGAVSLYGHVHSWAERDQAERAAWQAPGVREVSNHLLVSL